MYKSLTDKSSITGVKGPLKKNKTKVLMTTCSLMKAESVPECSPSAILLTCIKGELVLKTNFHSF